MLINYVGIPGCGKTYQTNLAKEYCTTNNIPYLDVSHRKDAPFVIKFLLLTIEKFVLCTKDYRNSIVYLEGKAANVTPRFLPFSISYCVQRIVCAIVLNRLFGHKRMFFFDDEGVFQWVAFLHLQYGVSLEDIVDICGVAKYKWDTIYVNAPIEEAFHNIKNRNRHVCEMDEMDDKVLFKYLSEYKSACDDLSKLFNFKANFKETLNCNGTFFN